MTSALSIRMSWLSPLLCCLLPFPSASSLAQGDIPVEQLLFEPVPLVQDGETPLPAHGVLALDAAVPTPGEEPPVLPPPQGSQLELIREIESYLASMEENEATAGPYSPELMEDLVSVGRLYQSREQHREALRALRRAHSIMRVNTGLSALEQVPVLEAMITSYEALQQYKEADEMQELILRLHQSTYGETSAAVVPALASLGDWNVKAFLDRSNILTNINRIDAQRFVMDPNNYVAPLDDPRNSPLFKLYQAQGNFLKAIEILVNERSYDHPDLQDLERKLLTTYLLSIHRENILYEPDFYLTRKKAKTGSRLNRNSIELMESEEYSRGLASLKRSIMYLSGSEGAKPMPLAEALLEEADWDLLYSRKVRAADKYQAAYDYLLANPPLAEAAAQVLYPAVPKVLPVYLPPPNSREKLNIPEDEQVRYLGWYDVSFSIDKYGKAKKVKILDSEGQVTTNMQIRLNQYLRNVQFRPRFTEGKPDTGVIALRYYIGY